jgi:diaminopimelate epimerase
MRFTKMHGIGNDYVYVNGFAETVADPAQLARKISDRHLGVGGDGLILILPSDKADVRMRMFNADGSEAEMCGNGVRCVARYLAERGAGERFAIATAAGLIDIEIVSRRPAFLVRVDMGVPRFLDAAARSLEAAGRSWDVHRVSTGNPHAVIFVDDVEAVDLERLGRELGAHELFPEGVNVHVARRVDARTLQVRHYERGVGLTQACGTGAVASAAAARRAGLVAAPLTVRVPGGTLEIDWTPAGTATMTGPAEHVLEREIGL